MFGLFGKKDKPAEPRPLQSTKSVDPMIKALKDRIAEMKPNDPLIAPKIAGREITNRVMAGLKNDKGVHIESFYTVVGALAGFSCQVSVCEQKRAGTQSLPAGKAPWAVVTGKDGKKYYFGDGINQPLAEQQYSIWGLAAGACQQLGVPAPDVNDIFNHVTASVGTESFGVPRIPADHRPGDLPVNYLKVIWPMSSLSPANFAKIPRNGPSPSPSPFNKASSWAKTRLIQRSPRRSSWNAPSPCRRSTCRN